MAEYAAKRRYAGQAASDYVARRTSTKRSIRTWNPELGVVGRILDGLPARLRVLDVSGLFVANHWNYTLRLAYRLETPFCGVPSAKTVVELKQQLREVDAENLLVFHNDHKPAAAAYVEYLANELARPSVTVRRGQFEVSVYPIRRLLNAKKTLEPTSKFSTKGRNDRIVIGRGLRAVAVAQPRDGGHLLGARE